MKSRHKLAGLYLVVSPILPDEQLLIAVEKALDGGVDILQFSASKESVEMSILANGLSGLARKHGIPFIVNNNLELAREVKAEGVHLDTFEVFPAEVRSLLGDESIVGYTVNFNLEKTKLAEKVNADYVSFCSVFHQCPGNQCPIVPIDKIKEVTSSTKLSVFAAGGINLENILLVLQAGVDGVAVTTAILKSKDPQQTAKDLKQVITEYGKN